MNCEGNLRDLGENGKLLEGEMKVSMSEATDKQRANMQVSTRDYKSPLGKRLKHHRKKNGKCKSANRRYK